MLITSRFLINTYDRPREREKKNYAHNAAWFDPRAAILTTRALSANLIADRQWRDSMKKKIWFVINSSHDWSLKCIFFKWNITRHFITFLSLTCTHMHTYIIHIHTQSRVVPRHIYLFSRFIWHIRAIVLQLWIHPIRFISSYLDFWEIMIVSSMRLECRYQFSKAREHSLAYELWTRRKSAEDKIYQSVGIPKARNFNKPRTFHDLVREDVPS